PPPCTSVNVINQIDTYIDSTNHWTNRFYNRQTIKLENFSPLWNLPCFYNDSAFDYIKLRQDSNLRTAKYFGLQNPDCQDYGMCRFQFLSEIHQHADTLFNVQPWTYSEVVKTGLGLTLYSFESCFEVGIGEWLTAYRKGNDTVGTFTPDSILL